MLVECSYSNLDYYYNNLLKLKLWKMYKHHSHLLADCSVFPTVKCYFLLCVDQRGVLAS